MSLSPIFLQRTCAQIFKPFGNNQTVATLIAGCPECLCAALECEFMEMYESVSSKENRDHPTSREEFNEGIWSQGTYKCCRMRERDGIFQSPGNCYCSWAETYNLTFTTHNAGGPTAAKAKFPPEAKRFLPSSQL